MKLQTVLLFIAFLLGIFLVDAQESSSLPSVTIKTLEGSTFNTSDISNDGKPIVISFWATWCKPCIRELNAIQEEYEDWQEETGVKLIAISIDDVRNVHRVAPFVNGRGWEYEVYLDENSDFRRAMNVNNVPHTFVLNGNLEVVEQHNSYAPGDEEDLYDKLVEMAEKGK
ncbi:MAG: TlpA disulfide reductase family protein [Bacteroidota bacterium]